MQFQKGGMRTAWVICCSVFLRYFPRQEPCACAEIMNDEGGRVSRVWEEVAAAGLFICYARVALFLALQLGLFSVAIFGNRTAA